MIQKNIKSGFSFVQTALTCLAILTSVIFGVVASNPNPLIIGLALGGVVSLFFIRKPSYTIWIILFFGLLFAGTVPLWTEGLGTKVTWAISIIGLMLLSISIYNVVTSQIKLKSTPTFTVMLAVFVVYCVINSLFNWYSAYEFFGGFKRYFQVVGLVFAFSWLNLTSKEITSLKKLLLFVVIAQLPWAIYELLSLVPLRESMRYAYPGMIPIDVVAGTFGASRYGGGSSGDMAIFLILTLGFILALLKESKSNKNNYLKLLPFILAPLFMGETKIVVVLLPILFITIYRKELIKRPIFGFFVLLLGAALTISTLSVYSLFHGDSINKGIEHTLDYNLQSTGYGGNALNRTTALTFWFTEQGLDDPLGFVFGHGIGSAHSSTGGHYSIKYIGYGIDLTTASTLLWEQGVLGTLIFLSVFYFAWSAASSIIRTSTSPLEKAYTLAIQSSLPLFLIYLVYRVSFLENLPFQIIFYLMLGYLSLQWKNNKSIIK